MKEQDIKNFISQEVQRQVSASSLYSPTVTNQKSSMFQSGNPTMNVHTHDGVNSPRITSGNIIPSAAVFGFVTFDENKTYTLNFAATNPTRLDLNGFAFNGSDNSCALIVGVAFLSKAMSFQPYTSAAVREGGTPWPIRGILGQCCSSLYVNQTTGGTGGTAEIPFPHVDENYIVNAYSTGGSHVATAQAVNFTGTSVDIVVTNLPSGWSLKTNFIIT